MYETALQLADPSQLLTSVADYTDIPDLQVRGTDESQIQGECSGSMLEEHLRMAVARNTDSKTAHLKLCALTLGGSNLSMLFGAAHPRKKTGSFCFWLDSHQRDRQGKRGGEDGAYFGTYRGFDAFVDHVKDIVSTSTFYTIVPLVQPQAGPISQPRPTGNRSRKRAAVADDDESDPEVDDVVSADTYVTTRASRSSGRRPSKRQRCGEDDSMSLDVLLEDPQAAVGLRVAKPFEQDDGKVHSGQVVNYDSDEEDPGKILFQIEYEDGDIEDMDADELLEHLVQG